MADLLSDRVVTGRDVRVPQFGTLTFLPVTTLPKVSTPEKNLPGKKSTRIGDRAGRVLICWRYFLAEVLGYREFFL